MKKRRAGRKKFHETRHSIYKGVRERNGKWVCELRQPNNKTRVWLETASLNFPHAATLLPRLDSQRSSIRSIQFAATKAVEKRFSSCQDSKPFLTNIASNGSESLDCNISVCMEKKVLKDSGSFFWDEEEVFNMPSLINNMAEGLIITPPALQRGFNWVDGETAMDLTLWEN